MSDVGGGPQTCERLRGKMIGLPGEAAESGSAASPEQSSLAPITGRWAIRTCEARSDGLHFARVLTVFGEQSDAAGD